MQTKKPNKEKRVRKSKFSNKYSDRIASIREADEKARKRNKPTTTKKATRTTTKSTVTRRPKVVNANAYTKNEHTAYLYECTNNFYEALDEFMDYVQNPYFTDENVEKESTLEGDNTTNKDKIEKNTQAIVTLKGQVGEGNVADQISTAVEAAKTEIKGSATGLTDFGLVENQIKANSDAIKALLKDIKAGNGVEISEKVEDGSKTISVKIDPASNEALTVSENGVKLSDAWDCGTFTA